MVSRLAYSKYGLNSAKPDFFGGGRGSGFTNSGRLTGLFSAFFTKSAYRAYAHSDYAESSARIDIFFLQWRGQLWARGYVPPWRLREFFPLGYTLSGLVLCQTLNLSPFVQPYSLCNNTITGYNYYYYYYLHSYTKYKH